jgi:hypothetical protein
VFSSGRARNGIFKAKPRSSRVGTCVFVSPYSFADDALFFLPSSLCCHNREKEKISSQSTFEAKSTQSAALNFFDNPHTTTTLVKKNQSIDTNNQIPRELDHSNKMMMTCALLLS